MAKSWTVELGGGSVRTLSVLDDEQSEGWESELGGQRRPRSTTNAEDEMTRFRAQALCRGFG